MYLIIERSAYKTSAFVSSDHEDAKAVIVSLAEELGFESVNGGKLSVALPARRDSRIDHCMSRVLNAALCRVRAVAASFVFDRRTPF
jgi:predicted dinucleotide-binding enzyme